MSPAGPVKAVLFDRDGTLVHDVPYNGDPDRVRPVEGAREAVALLREHGIRVGVVTNQSGVARGLISDGDVRRVNRRVDELIGPFDVWAVCPHGPDDGCHCRKPEPGMVLWAAGRVCTGPADCVVVGDIGADMEAAERAGAHGILVPNDRTRPEETAAAAHVAPDLLTAVRAVLDGPPRGRSPVNEPPAGAAFGPGPGSTGPRTAADRPGPAEPSPATPPGRGTRRPRDTARHPLPAPHPDEAGLPVATGAGSGRGGFCAEWGRGGASVVGASAPDSVGSAVATGAGSGRGGSCAEWGRGGASVVGASAPDSVGSAVATGAGSGRDGSCAESGRGGTTAARTRAPDPAGAARTRAGVDATARGTCAPGSAEVAGTRAGVDGEAAGTRAPDPAGAARTRAVADAGAARTPAGADGGAACGAVGDDGRGRPA